MSAPQLLRELIDIFDAELREDVEIDVTLFLNEDFNRCANMDQISNNDVIIKNCCHLQRIAVALSYYQFMCQGRIDDHLFIEFCQITYINFLDDYCHLIIQHNHQIYQIRETLIEQYLMKQCDLNQCESIIRHYRTSTLSTASDKIQVLFKYSK